MTVDQGNLHINLFRDMKGIKTAASITWDEGNNHYRVSLRSANHMVSQVALKFGGGGHDYAAGCHIDSLEELPALLSECDQIPD